jgi:hypothetical protein
MEREQLHAIRSKKGSTPAGRSKAAVDRDLRAMLGPGSKLRTGRRNASATDDVAAVRDLAVRWREARRA